mmetsp:Transcript_4731/g.15295  ORF Transcript_4731/g.15295 Transcript_4731/m.15295 type:complete len:222 (+) Transcript_4731:39-704(+)
MTSLSCSSFVRRRKAVGQGGHEPLVHHRLGRRRRLVKVASLSALFGHFVRCHLQRPSEEERRSHAVKVSGCRRGQGHGEHAQAVASPVDRLGGALANVVSKGCCNVGWQRRSAGSCVGCRCGCGRVENGVESHRRFAQQRQLSVCPAAQALQHRSTLLECYQSSRTVSSGCRGRWVGEDATVGVGLAEEASESARVLRQRGRDGGWCGGTARRGKGRGWYC